jgi:hypothetical protein
MTYEMRPEFVETQYLIPELERFFSAIKLKDSVGAEQHDRYMRSCFREIIMTPNGVFASGVTQATDAGSFLEVVIFVLNKCCSFGDEVRRRRRQAEIDLARKYLPADTHEVRIALGRDPEAGPLIADLASLPNSWFSTGALKALKETYDALVEKARVGQESIDEILKGR